MRRRRHEEPVPTGTGRHGTSHALAVKLHWVLRIGVALEILGHGLAGFYRPPGWIPYFTFFGIRETFAHDYTTYITGTVDVALAIVVLVRPMRAVMLHIAVWGLLTALLRPLTGESWFELVERGANYGMPLALLVLSGWGGRSLSCGSGASARPNRSVVNSSERWQWITKGSIALLLVGHGGLGIWAAKREWFDFLEWFGVADSSQAVDVRSGSASSRWCSPLQY